MASAHGCSIRDSFGSRSLEPQSKHIHDVSPNRVRIAHKRVPTNRQGRGSRKRQGEPKQKKEQRFTKSKKHYKNRSTKCRARKDAFVPESAATAREEGPSARAKSIQCHRCAHRPTSVVWSKGTVSRRSWPCSSTTASTRPCTSTRCTYHVCACPLTRTSSPGANLRQDVFQPTGRFIMRVMGANAVWPMSV